MIVSYPGKSRRTLTKNRFIMKKAVLTLIMALAFIGVFAQFFPETKKDFFQVYQETLQLNEGRFTDINLIQVGDTVLLTSLFVGDPTIYRWVADAPEVNNGRHDCVWLISERYYFQNISQPMVVEPVTPEPEPVPAKANKKDIIYLWLFGIMAGLIVLYFLITEIRKRRPINPNSQPPVMRDGLSNDDATAIRQIAQNQNLSPENITKMERCMLVRHSGPTKIKVLMEFRNGTKKSYVTPGELVSRITIEEDGKTRVEYWRNHCGNRFGAIKEGQFELPAGWEAVVQNTYSNPEARANAEQQATEEAAAQQASAPVVQAPKTFFDAEGIATIIRSLPKGVTKMEITPDGIKIAVGPNKKK